MNKYGQCDRDVASLRVTEGQLATYLLAGILNQPGQMATCQPVNSV